MAALTPKHELPWTSTEAWVRVVSYYILLLALMLSLQLGLGGLTREWVKNDFAVANVLAGVIGIIGIGLTFLFLKFDGRPMRQIGVFLPSGLVVLTIVGLLATPVALAFTYLIEWLGGVVDFDQMWRDRITDPVLFALRALIVLVGIGVGEELMFRGYLQRVLESQLSFWKASAITAVAFGLLHSFLYTSAIENVVYKMVAIGCSATIFGFVFSYAYKMTGRNLYLPILIHGLWDILIFYWNTAFVYNDFVMVAVEIFSQVVAAAIFFLFLLLLQKFYEPQEVLKAWNEE